MSAYLIIYLLSLTEIVPLTDQTNHELLENRPLNLTISAAFILFTNSEAEASSTLLPKHNQTAQHSTTHSDWTPTQTQRATQLRVTEGSCCANFARQHHRQLLKHVRRKKSKRNEAKRFVVADKIFHPQHTVITHSSTPTTLLFNSLTNYVSLPKINIIHFSFYRTLHDHSSSLSCTTTTLPPTNSALQNI